MIKKATSKPVKFRQRRAVTLVEAMMTTLVLTVAVLGTSGYRYYAALDARRADAHVTAARLASLLCESWKGVKGTETYDITEDLGSELVIETIYEGPAMPSEAGLLGYYRITVEGVAYNAVLWWRDLEVDYDTGRRLRSLNVIMGWDWRHSQHWWYFHNNSLRLTTYTLVI